MIDHLHIAIDAVKTASEICRTIQAQLVSEDALTKKDKSPVTIADFASQAIICKTLKKHFPEIPIVGEENAHSLRLEENRAMLEKIAAFLPGWQPDDILTAVDQGSGDATNLFWTLDPIDGTKGFLRGEQYAVALALIVNGKPEIGVLGCPNLPFTEMSDEGTIAFARRNEGAFTRCLTGGIINSAQVSNHDAATTVRFLESVESGHADHGLQAKIMANFGEWAEAVRFDSQVKYAVLARGLADVYLRLPNPDKPDYREKIWDHAAGCIIVQEAGGRVTDVFGNDLDFSRGKKLLNNRGIIVTNNRLHEEVLRVVKKAME